MNLKEFRSTLKKEANPSPTPEEFKIIEYVYNHHPSISSNPLLAKEQISRIYTLGGMRLIRDMIPTAQKAEELEVAIRNTRLRLSSLQQEYLELVNSLV